MDIQGLKNTSLFSPNLSNIKGYTTPKRNTISIQQRET